MLKLEKGFDKFANFIGYITAIVMVLMILNVFYDVVMRYFFRSGSIAMQEMEWHLFSVIILLGISYTLKEDGHVRVDLIYDTLKDKKKAMINMIGVVLFILPISLLIGFGSIDYVIEAYQSGEQSGDPGGLTNRWLVKSLIPISFFLLIITSIGFFIKNLNVYRGLHPVAPHMVKGEIDTIVNDVHKSEDNLHKGDK
ncbi:TRAP transporter small permease subunit [Poseidonibacter ostreae]|jgi:TRAP-type mannitol/chloroaromatic compound transport system permease small subunit|uniref:TRAP transporter small permease subunit n=1 Tax=Poseidonibacter ostreae TaxID=2654171 RepID=A0A6L4WTJ4_9BACT|nr:TRAP transporter small permease subunit [Poseidonibacter ostreae]KAB7889292.1 TRAP transporter small permease subunit [Poseidonibacter ostreae]KAB7892137.1 TRAP transporter small permease subunit [Poseidonibacter ostreae]